MEKKIEAGKRQSRHLFLFPGQARPRIDERRMAKVAADSRALTMEPANTVRKVMFFHFLRFLRAAFVTAM
jgi:hypothetical protein